MKHFQLFWAFFKVGVLGYGGGPSSIPLVHQEVVTKYKWINDDEFADILAIGNTLPGPIATKMAGYIGYRVAGWIGVCNAVISTILPSVAAIIILLSSLSSFQDQEWVGGMTNAIVPVVGVMLAILTWEFFNKSKQSLGWLPSIGLTAGSLLMMEAVGVHPAFLIFGLLLAALVKKDKQTTNEQRGQSL